MYEQFFDPKSVAVIGASPNEGKIGHVLLKGLIRTKYPGKIYPINPSAKKILGIKTYASITEAVKAHGKPIDLAVVAVPTYPSILVTEECGKVGVKNVLSITAGFSEVGNHGAEKKLKEVIEKQKINFIGPNCLGIIDSFTGIDLIFLPTDRLKRPAPGKVSFICQSGAVGSTTLDLLSSQGLGLSKFITYGNATTTNETHLLEYLKDDKHTDVVCMYIEGVRDGKRFIKVAKEVTKKKPVIILKGGLTESGAHATLSHTASLAGSGEVYKGAFRQTNVIQADALHDLYDYAKILEKCPKPKGRRVQVITNGGGFGILCVDAIDKNKLKLAKLSKKTEQALEKKFPKEYVVHNPIDVTGGAKAEDYELTLEACLKEKSNDIILVVLLMQTPLLDIKAVDMIAKVNKKTKKPIVVVITGGAFSQMQKQRLESMGVPCYTYPSNAVKSIAAFCAYHGV